jgi:hypothetical protein
MRGCCGGALGACLASSWRRGALRATCGCAGGGTGRGVGFGCGVGAGKAACGARVGGVVGGAALGSGTGVLGVAFAARGCARESVTVSDSPPLTPATFAGKSRTPKNTTSDRCKSSESAYANA